MPLNAADEPFRSPKRISLPEAVQLRAELRAQGRSLVVTNGCFDLLHAGHVAFLQAAATLGDELWVLLNGDASVRALKGEGRPLQPEAARAFCLAGLACVSRVIVFTEPRLTDELRQLRPEHYAKAGDYSLDTLHRGERLALESAGAEIHFMPFVAGLSTTGLVERITATSGDKAPRDQASDPGR